MKNRDELQDLDSVWSINVSIMNEQIHYEDIPDIPDDEEGNSVTISKCIGSIDKNN